MPRRSPLTDSAPEPPLRMARRAALTYSLSQAPIFAGLPESDLLRLASYCEVEQVPRGKHLFRQGDPVRGFFLVRTGAIRVYRRTGEGEEQAIHLLRPGDSFAERAMISETGYPANSRALEESEVILIPAEKFRLHQKERPDLAWRMLSSMSHHLRSLVAQLEGLRFGDVERRLIHWLLQRASLQERDLPQKEPAEFALGITQSSLAKELATRRETLSRTLRKLQNEGVLVFKKGRITLYAPALLKARLQDGRLVVSTN